MVQDKIPIYYDALIRAIKEDYPDATGSRTFTDTPQKFPHIYFKRLNSSDTLQTLSRGAKGINNSVEIHAYHNEGIKKAENFALKVREVCSDQLGMNCDYFNQMDNVSNSKIIQFVMRFSSLDT